MKFTIEKTEFEKALFNVIRVADEKTGLYIKAEADTVTVIGTDIAISLKGWCNADIEESGHIMTDKKLFDIIKSLKDDITLSTESTILKIKSGKASFEIPFQNGDNYPIPEEEKDFCEAHISAVELNKAINKTMHAIGINSSKAILQGSLFEFNGSNLSVVSLDGYRLAKYDCNVECQQGFKIIIPFKAITELKKVISGETVKILRSEKRAIFKNECFEMWTRLIDGEFPNYNSLIPQKFNIEVPFYRSVLLSTLERCRLISDETREPVRIEFQKNNVSFSSVSRKGKVTEKITVENNDELTIGFNPKYLVQALKEFENEKITFEMNGSLQPIIIREDNFLNLILPVRLRGKEDEIL